MRLDATRLRDAIDKLGTRERRLVGILGVVLLVMVILLVPIGASAMLGSRRDANRALRESIAAIKNGRDRVRSRQAKREAIAARYATRAPALAGLIEKAARDQHLEIPESQDRADVPHGKRYAERATVVRLRKATMLQLAKMLEALESQHMPVAITRLNIRRRGGERDSYDIELGVSAFDRAETGGAAAAGAGPGSGAAGGAGPGAGAGAPTGAATATGVPSGEGGVP